MLFTKILSENLKHNFPIHFILAVAVALLTPIVFSISALDSRMSAQPLEMLLPFIGTILLTPVFLPEQNPEIRDVIRSKKTSCLTIWLIRVAYSVVAVMLITGVFVLAMKCCECDVTIRHFIGSVASSLFLGTIGVAVSGLSNSISAGYMASMVYYSANIGLKDKLGVCYLFSMYSGEDFSVKYWLTALSVIIIAGVFIILRKTAR
ncbi:MAG: hypothetical protein NC340_08405 [Ruminococcus flavefaciens]|nr:hypothetical protein [Ruminococcus flavefaciens]MCM1230310.1 hypothetical protein [Ruminococcus flavefaciens]